MKSKEALQNIKNLFIGSVINFSDNFELIEYDLDKLQEYRKIEEELEISLITVFKALKNGFYGKDYSGNITFYKDNDDTLVSITPNGSYEDKQNFFLIEAYKKDKFGELTNLAEYFFNEYGKMWALTKEELL